MDPVTMQQPEDGFVDHPHAEDFAQARILPGDRTWFKKAVFPRGAGYERSTTRTRRVGDLCGLIDRLDYLQWLGVDCPWLPPFYDSPLRDGGYDIRDFLPVLPEFGTVDDFVALLDAAHRRGIR